MNFRTFHLKRLIWGLAVLTSLISLDVTAQEDTFIIDDTQFAINYLIDGVPDPDLVLVRGRTYTFQLSTPGHPFCVKTAPTLGEIDDRYDIGVTNNCIENGTLTFVVPLDAPNLLYYICSVHILMTAQILIVDALPIFSDGFES